MFDPTRIFVCAMIAIAIFLLLILIIAASVKRSRKERHEEQEKESRLAAIGREGENVFAQRIVAKSSPGSLLLQNIYVPMGKGRTTEIDSIIINSYGIFVFEVKNYRGAIFGTENSEEWVQSSGRQSRAFYNPIKQNETHISVLRNFLANNGLPIPPIKGFVVFGDHAFLSEDIKWINNGFSVVRFASFPERYNEYVSVFMDRQKLSQRDVERIYDVVERKCVDVSDSVKRNHIEYVKNRYQSY